MADSQRRFDKHTQSQDAQWQGALVDDTGREQPITETMIARACAQLEASYSIGVSSESPAPAEQRVPRR